MRSWHSSIDDRGWWFICTVQRCCVTIALPLSGRAIESVRAGVRPRSAVSGANRLEGRGAAGDVDSLDQVSLARRYNERSPPLPVLSEHTIFYLVDTITSFDGPGACAKVESYTDRPKNFFEMQEPRAEIARTKCNGFRFPVAHEQGRPWPISGKWDTATNSIRMRDELTRTCLFLHTGCLSQRHMFLICKNDLDLDLVQ